MKAFRSYHLLFAAAVLVAYLTAEELGLVHAWTGYAIAGLLLLRAILGMARARGFKFRRLLPKLSPAPRGMSGLRHPFVASTLTLALFLSIAGAAVTGIVMDRGGTLTGNSIRAHDEEREREREHDRDDDFALLAPLSPVVSAYAGSVEREAREVEEGVLGELHETFGNLMLPLLFVHALYFLLFRFEMARFMLFAQRRQQRPNE